MTEIPVIFIFPAIQGIICYYIVGLNDYHAGKIFIFLAGLIGMALSGNALGLLVSCAFSDPKVAIGVAPLFFLPLQIFGGLYINTGSLGSYISWLHWISPFKYAFEALVTNEF